MQWCVGAGVHAYDVRMSNSTPHFAHRDSSPTSYKIRPLTVDDAANYHAFRLEGLRLYPDAFRSSYEDDIHKPLAWAQKRIASSSENPHGIALGAFDEASHQLIGTIVLETTARRKLRHVADVVGMLVAPSHSGKGVGSALLYALIAQAQGIPELELLHLTVTSTNESAIRLYERNGFEREGIERHVMKIGEQYFDKLHMSLELDIKQDDLSFEEQMKVAREVMAERREALAKLAKS